MAHHKHPGARAPFPTKDEILEFIRESPERVGKREIARAFRLKGDDRIRLKEVLHELQDEGAIDRGRGKRFAEPGTLPEVTVVVVSEIDTDGEVIARPQSWDVEDFGPPPKIYMAPQRHGEQALGLGDRALVRLSHVDAQTYEGKVIRIIAQAPPLVLGVIKIDAEGRARVLPTDKRHRHDYMVAPEDNTNIPLK